MKLYSVKIPKRKKSKNTEPVCISEYHEDYPYGLRIRFEKKQIESVPGVGDLEVGSNVNISAVGKVISIRKDENDQSVEIQIQEIGIEGKKALKDMSQAEYNKVRGQGRVR